jgi:AraC-like DNA-binding protein
MNVSAVAYASEESLPPDHRAGPLSCPQGQLLYVISGTLELATDAQMWLLSPQHGLWIPACMRYTLRARSGVLLCHVRIDRAVCRSSLPEAARTLMVSPLLRELILRTASLRHACKDDRKAELIRTLIEDEISWTASPSLLLPADERLRRVCMAIIDNPADRRTLTDWADCAATSSRTLARLFHAQLGMSFQHWRQLALATSALPRLRAGEPVTKVALDLGYETPGAFSAMFRRVMQTCPSEYRSIDAADAALMDGAARLAG